MPLEIPLLVVDLFQLAGQTYFTYIDWLTGWLDLSLGGAFSKIMKHQEILYQVEAPEQLITGVGTNLVSGDMAILPKR